MRHGESVADFLHPARGKERKGKEVTEENLGFPLFQATRPEPKASVAPASPTGKNHA
jgi:hypothetical protein